MTYQEIADALKTIVADEISKAPQDRYWIEPLDGLIDQLQSLEAKNKGE